MHKRVDNIQIEKSKPDVATLWDMPAMRLSPGDQALKIGADLKQFMRVNQVVGSKDLTPTSISSSLWVQSD